MTRSLTVRLLALVAVVLASFWYIAFEVAGWRFGAQDYHVTVMMSRAGGVYTEADVTYRGVSVGRVTRLQLVPGGVAVHAEIDPGVKIPKAVTAQVRELSAAGEQYLDLVPASGAGPYLVDGSVVAQAHTTQPVPIASVLSDTSRLLDSVNAGNLNVVIRSLSSGFGGTGGDLRNIVVAGQNLIQALEAAQPATVELITGGQTVLSGLANTDHAFGQFATGLQSLTAQLKQSNPDINALLANGIATENQTSQLLNQYSGSFESLLTNAGTVSAVTAAQQQSVQALFQVLPVFAGRIGAVVHNGSLHVELYFNTSNPVCPYVSGAGTPLPTAKTGAPDLGRSCAVSAAGMLARGAPSTP